MLRPLYRSLVVFGRLPSPPLPILKRGLVVTSRQFSNEKPPTRNDDLPQSQHHNPSEPPPSETGISQQSERPVENLASEGKRDDEGLDRQRLAPTANSMKTPDAEKRRRGRRKKEQEQDYITRILCHISR